MDKPKYFERWFRAKNQPISPLPQQAAEARHTAGDSYVAVLQSQGEKFVVDIAAGWLSVLFFDANDRLYLKYDFKKIEPEHLFLSAALHFEFEDLSNGLHAAVTFAFKTDGSIVIERRNVVTGIVEEKDSYAVPAANWEPYPEFGEYLSVCRANREL